MKQLLFLLFISLQVSALDPVEIAILESNPTQLEIAFQQKITTQYPSEKISAGILVGFFGMGLPTLIKLWNNDFLAYHNDKYVRSIQKASYATALILLMLGIKEQSENWNKNIELNDNARENKQIIYIV